ncbi:MAG: type II toxin-antitoxin system ParD family antitoxin [Verrucomicrobiaceae bacterium]|nr:MAG: type II toxin-antitoxin system ParD family antitoxin [Verrucomicrobiaceae bacterium]
MHVSLTPELEHQVRLKVESGLYNNASEVIRESLRMMLERDAIQQRLKDELNVGISQLKRGEGVSVTDKDGFMAQARSNQ